MKTELCGFQHFEQLLGLPVADAGEHGEHARAGDGVSRIFRQPQERQKVLHVGRFDELQSAVLVKRNVSARQLDFEREAVMRRTEKHRLCGKRRARLALLENAVNDEVGLLIVVDALNELRRRSVDSR